MKNVVMSRRSIVSAGLLVSILGLAGCAGFAADGAGEIVSSAAAVVQAGKCDVFIAAPWEKMIGHVHQAARDLALKPMKEEVHPEQRKMTYEDDRKQVVVVTVVRRTRAVSEVKVDVGVFGVQDLARLMLQRIVDDTGEATSTVQPSRTVATPPHNQ